MPNRRWVTETLALVRSHFGAPVYFTRPDQLRGLKMPVIVIAGPNDTIEEGGNTIFREFTLEHWFDVGPDSDGKDPVSAYDEVDQFVKHIMNPEVRPADAYVSGNPVIVASVESPELSPDAGPYRYLITINFTQTLSIKD